MQDLLYLENISYKYSQDTENILENLFFRFNKGERTGIIGPNGRGKTTFLHICMGILHPSNGNLYHKGQIVNTNKKIQELRRSIGLVFQNPDDQLFSPTVLEDVAFGPLNLGFDAKQASEIATHTLDMVGLHGYEERITHKLSGGEKKILSIATILAMNPEAILFDEPTSGLDNDTREHLIEVLNKIDQSMLVVTHDWDFLNRIASTLYNLEDKTLTQHDIRMLHNHTHLHPHGHVPHEHEDSFN